MISSKYFFYPIMCLFFPIVSTHLFISWFRCEHDFLSKVLFGRLWLL